MKDSLEYMLTNILDTKVDIEENDDEGFITYTIIAPQEVIGKIIGKGGRTINSMKNLLKIQAIKEEKRIDIQVKEAGAAE